MATLNQFEFNKVIAKLQSAKTDLPVRIANIAKNHFVNNFKVQAYYGEPWQEVQRRIPGTSSFKYPKKRDLARRRRSILLGKTRNLLKSVNNSFRQATWEIIRLGTDVIYAEYLNDGTDKMPARTFMKHDKQLDTDIKHEIERQIKIVLKGS